MIECFETESSLYILMQFVAPSLSLYKHYQSAAARSITVEQKRHVFEQIIAGVQHMHDNQFAHLGIAPDHILLTDKNKVKLSFLVVCKNVGPGEYLNTMCGTTHTVAPEILKGERYNPFMADVWSCGVVLFYMLNDGCYPFDGANTVKHILAYAGGRAQIRRHNPAIPFDARDLVEKMLEPDPEKRITLQKLLSHPFMGGHAVQQISVKAAVAWDDAGERLRIKLPPGLSKIEQAACLIQGVWKFLRIQKQAKLIAGTVAPEDPIIPLYPGSSTFDSSEGQKTAPKIPKSLSNKHQCSACGRLPPPRVSETKPPFPNARIKFDGHGGYFVDAVPRKSIFADDGARVRSGADGV